MIIGENTVEMDPVKVQAVAEWPVPTCKRDVQVFLGFTNFLLAIHQRLCQNG